MNKFNFDDAPNNAYQFFAGDVSAKVEQADGKTKRTFSGIAYHGGIIENHWHWGNVAFDLDGLKLANGKVPMLMQHDDERRAGFINTHSIDESGLSVEGVLLANAHGSMVADDGDAGYPWQMSVRIIPNRVDVVETGQVVVNGRTFNAPVTIFRQNTIREVSFCALGADMHTSAQIFNQSNNQNQSHNLKGINVELEQAQAKITELEASLSQKSVELQNAVNELKQFAESKRDADIQALAEKTGQEFSAEKIATFKSMDEINFSLVASLIPAKAEPQTLPENLFTEQAHNGQEPVNEFTAKFKAWSEK